MSYQLCVLKAPRLCSSPTGHSLFLSRVILPRATLSWRGLHIRGSTRLQPSLRWPNFSLHPHRPGSRILYIVLRPPITDYMIDDAARSPWEMALVNAEPAPGKSLKATVFDFWFHPGPTDIGETGPKCWRIVSSRSARRFRMLKRKVTWTLRRRGPGIGWIQSVIKHFVGCISSFNHPIPDIKLYSWLLDNFVCSYWMRTIGGGRADRWSLDYCSEFTLLAVMCTWSATSTSSSR